MKNNIWLNGMMGVVVGDALGNPVQFKSRESIKQRKNGPVTGMEDGGVFNTPKGTWTDDGSMSIATMVSIIETRSIDADDIMNKFVEWHDNGEYTPFGQSFDIGATCSRAICNYNMNHNVDTCGITGEYANGNGSLMRIMPACIYQYEKLSKNEISLEEAVNGIHMIARLTHNHLRNMICCGIYFFCVKAILDGLKNDKNAKLNDLLQSGIDVGYNYYKNDISNLTELTHIGRIVSLDEFKNLPEDNIKSSGYVVDSIEAAMWSLANTYSFEECLLKAVNLGDDADSVGAIAGGLAGLYYGYANMPVEWIDVIQRRKWIEDLCDQMSC